MFYRLFKYTFNEFTPSNGYTGLWFKEMGTKIQEEPYISKIQVDNKI